MSESTRRRKYRYDRIVIEATRILSPQFGDAVVYLTGAQIELLRNITEYLHRIETYSSEYHLGYYLVPTTADYDDLMAIVADLEETLMGNPNTLFGYNDVMKEYEIEYSADSGWNLMDLGPVPENEVWVLTSLTAYDATSAISSVSLGVKFSTHTHYLGSLGSPAAGQQNNWTGHIYMPEGAYVSVGFSGCTAGDQLRVLSAGYKMVLS